jgi:DNA mismatch repair protein MutS2
VAIARQENGPAMVLQCTPSLTRSARILVVIGSEMNSHALEVLEFREALGAVATLASSPVGAEAVSRLAPRSELRWIAGELALVAEGIGAVGREAWVMPAIPDLREPLQRLHLEGYVWDGPTLRRAATLILSSRSLRRALRETAESAPGLAREAEPLAELEGSAEEILRVVGDEGEVRDNASPELNRLRREINGARNRIVSRLTEFAASLPPQLQVSDASISVREGRYVVPVRREGRGEVGGIVHGESQTGATLFIEPPLAIDLMNRLRELEAAEVREVQRILREQTERLRPHARVLSESMAALIRLDSIYARARYADRVDGHPPEVLASGTQSLALSHGRHPLLLAQGEKVVPFDLRMDQGERTLVISGPNTGGKTVLLKALGLISLMVQSGIVPPVGPGTRLPIFGDVFADIGDEQSIEASLSTFSAHLKNLRQTLDGADAGSLVLIDEIGSGTDPLEGAALARAILLDLTGRSALTVATTHLGALKLLAAEDPRIVNASLQFDAERLQPTYRFQKGIPGRSYGIAIARRLGLPPALLDAAEQALPQGERDVARLLLELEDKEQRLTRQTSELNASTARNQALEEELERRQRELQRREKESERRARQQARDLLMQSRKEVDEAIRAVREAGDAAALDEASRAARQRVEEAARRQRERTPTNDTRGKRAPGELRDLAPGTRVRIDSLGRTGTLLEIRDSKGVVDAGGMRLQLALDDLTALPPGDQNAGVQKPRARPAGGRFEVEMDARPEVDLRGMRPDELEMRLGRALDAALVSGLPSFRIIHGKGTGVLRATVHELLRADPRVASFRPGDRFEGGTGVTVAEFS